ncbi:hypothetical protein ABIB57_005166 [Devosia sp. UYZn731]|uniref:hypothetical protein n=1 Tax=Devosia sp. UYZn731 TaxID=3156345 RepID=UPI00339423AE
MNIAIKPVAANQIRAMAERYPDLSANELAKKGAWTYGQVTSALSKRRPDKPKSRAS